MQSRPRVGKPKNKDQKEKSPVPEQVAQQLEEQLSPFRTDTNDLELIDVGDDTEPTKPKEINMKIESCGECNKTIDELRAENKKLYKNMKDPNDPELYCEDCYRKKIIQSTPTPSVGRTIQSIPAIAIKESQIEEPKVNRASRNVNVDIQETLLDQLPKGTKIHDDLRELITKHKKREDDTNAYLKNNISNFWKEQEGNILQSGLITYPPICQWIMTVIDFIRNDIEINHPLTNFLETDIKNNKEILRDPIFSQFMPLFNYEFWLNNSELLNHLINVALLQLENLRLSLKEANYWSEDVEFNLETTRGFLIEFKYRNNPFEQKFELISHDPRELQKFFSGVEVCLTPLASIEQKLTKDTITKYNEAFSKLTEKQRDEMIVSHFSRSFKMAWFDDFDTPFKLKLFFRLLEDEDVYLSPNELLSMFNKFSRKDRTGFLQLLGTQLFPNEFSMVVPDLEKLKGKSNVISQ